MPTGFSLHIGVNQVDPDHYDGWSGPLDFCEDDAIASLKLARGAGFHDSRILLTRNATREAVLGELADIAQKARSGDLIFIFYSGHGGQIDDQNADEEDGMDETWCLYNGELVDDEQFHAYSQYPEGCRILIMSDSCHSGSVSKVYRAPAVPTAHARLLAQGNKSKLLLKDVADRTYALNSEFYDYILTREYNDEDDIGAAVLLISGCQDDELSYEGTQQGKLTEAILTVWNEGRFEGSYKEFHRQIAERLVPTQTPNFYLYGEGVHDFKNQYPFHIGADDTTPDVDPVTTGDEDLIVEYSDKTRSKPSITASKDQYAISKIDDRSAIYSVKAKSASNAWDRAYAVYQGEKKNKEPIVFVEPDMGHRAFIHEFVDKGPYPKGTNKYLQNWPQPKNVPDIFAWHLGDQFSQLKKARDTIINDPNLDKTIRIAHIDTGYEAGHPATPRELQHTLGISFMKGEEQNKGVDYDKSFSIGEQQGHGNGTISILAGNYLHPEQSDGSFEGFFGAIPFAEVIPIRISDTVALIKTRAFERALDYAVQMGCEVVTMSMAGLPSRRWARAINRAYESGVTVVTAASNNWNKGFGKAAPKAMLYPARFDRVVGATGVTFNHEPYDFNANSWQAPKAETGENMQGSWGPRSAMKTAIAAYTPNVSWGTLKNNFVQTGGGTSSATPQVAAAAALWIVKHRDLLKDVRGTWKQVEAVRWALFNSANKDYKQYRKYYGNGALRAFDAFSKRPALDKLKKSPKAYATKLGIVELFMGYLRGKAKSRSVDDVMSEMMALELAQLCHRDPALYRYLQIEERAAKKYSPRSSRTFFEAVGKSEFASQQLKRTAKRILKTLE